MPPGAGGSFAPPAAAVNVQTIATKSTAANRRIRSRIHRSGAGAPFLEPVVRVRLVVERIDLAVARGAIEADCLGERLVRLEPNDLRAVLSRVALELVQPAPADPEPARRLGHPHPLQLGRLVAVELQRAAADGLVPQRRDD